MDMKTKQKTYSTTEAPAQELREDDQPKTTNRTWEAFGRSQGCFVVNDPALKL